jgi:hypothetical protein
LWRTQAKTTGDLTVKKLAIFLGALALFAVQPAAGQIEYPGLPQDGDIVRYVTHSGVIGYVPGAGSYMVGPYTGAVLSYPGSPQFTMYCVDFSTLVSKAASGWEVNASQVAYGSDLHRAAYLASLFHSTATSKWATIHSAIWRLMGATGITATLAIQGYIDDANANFASVSHAGWYFLASNPQSASQDFLVRFSAPEPSVTVISTVPEPGVIVLLLSGLLGVAFVARRRSTALS